MITKEEMVGALKEVGKKAVSWDRCSSTILQLILKLLENQKEMKLDSIGSLKPEQIMDIFHKYF